MSSDEMEELKKKEQELSADLNMRERKFVLEYAKSGSGKDAAIMAGYAPSSAKSQASKLLKKQKIKKYLDVLMQEMETPAIATASEVLEYLSDVMRGLTTDQEFSPLGEKEEVRAPTKDRIKAAIQLLKRYPDDRLSKAQIRKLEADAKLSEAKAKQISSGKDPAEDTLAKILEKIAEKDKEDK